MSYISQWYIYKDMRSHGFSLYGSAGSKERIRSTLIEKLGSLTEMKKKGVVRANYWDRGSVAYSSTVTDHENTEYNNVKRNFACVAQCQLARFLDQTRRSSSVKRAFPRQ